MDPVINGPEIHSVYRWRNQHKVTLTCGLDEGNFKALKSVFSKLKDKLPCVPVIMAENETAIVPEIHYNQEQDKLQCICGAKGVNHKCLDRLEVPVGNGEDGYNTIINGEDGYNTIINGEDGYNTIINGEDGYNTIINGEDGYNTIINGEDGYNTIINVFLNFTIGCHIDQSTAPRISEDSSAHPSFL